MESKKSGAGELFRERFGGGAKSCVYIREPGDSVELHGSVQQALQLSPRCMAYINTLNAGAQLFCEVI